MNPDVFAALFEACPDPLVVVSGELIQSHNPAWKAQIGDEPSLRACFLPEDFPAVLAALEAAPRGRSSVDARLAGGAHANTSMRWSFWPAGDAAVCIRLDGRTPPVEEDPLRAKEKVLARIFDAIDAALWTIRRDGTIVLSTGNALAHYGMKPGQTEGMNAFTIYPEGSHPLLMLQRVLAGEHVRNEYVDEGIHWLQFCEPFLNPEGQVEALLGLGIATEKNTGELRHAQILMGIINKLPLVIWAVTVDGICTLSAGENLAQIGLKPGELVGANIFDFYRDNPTILNELQRALAGETVVTEMQMGERVWRTTHYQARAGTGEVTGLYAISEDITESKQAEQRMLEQLELIQTQKQAIASLVSPIIEVWSGVLVVPVIGNLSDERAAIVTENLLHEVVGRASRFVILDLTGVATVDASSAQHLFNIMRSVGLLGSTCLISGIQPGVARTMVTHEIALPSDRSYSTLAEALRRCLR